MNGSLPRSIKSWLPYVIGAILVVQFAALGVWQIDRGLDKRADRQAFDDRAGFMPFSDGMAVRPYQALEVGGEFDVEHQFLLDNIILNSRYGYYVLTPLVLAEDAPVLIVNRGWLEKTGPEVAAESIAIDAGRVAVRGRVGSLPRAGYRMGDAIESPSTWPQHAVYPTLDELAASLGKDVQPFVLLMDPQDEYGMIRHWVPEEMGPVRHYAYAFQWFAMCIVLAALLIWNYRKRGLES